jgi:hypothetical protein
MSLNRDDALFYLQNEFSAQLEDTGQSDGDTPDGFEPAINAALRELGVSRSDFLTATVADEDEAAFEAFLEYFALNRFAKLLAQNINVGVSGKNVSLQQAFANVKALLDAATTRAKAFGLGGSNSYSYQTLNLGFLATNSENEF